MYLGFFLSFFFLFLAFVLFIASTDGPIQPFNFYLRYYDFYGPGDFVLYRNKDRAFEVGVTMTYIIRELKVVRLDFLEGIPPKFKH